MQIIFHNTKTGDEFITPVSDVCFHHLPRKSESFTLWEDGDTDLLIKGKVKSVDWSAGIDGEYSVFIFIKPENEILIKLRYFFGRINKQIKRIGKNEMVKRYC